MTPALTLLFAVACGVVVAGLYYAQPLLVAIAGSFQVRPATAGLLVTVTQVGYALGLALIVPLGDVLDRRRLILGLLALTVLALGVAALAPSFALFALGCALIGVTSCAAQVLVPFAASLAEATQRGRIVGTVMSGLLLGILLARIASGLVGAALGWRAVFLLGAVLLLGLLGLLARFLPRDARAHPLPYPALLRSTLALLPQEAVLRLRSALGLLAFGTFSVLWTALTFLLSRPPYGYGEALIGAFGLLGVVGALSASVAGRLADRGHGGRASGVFALIILLAWGALLLGGHSLAALMAGIVLLDLGVQGLHISNQSEVYRLRPEARSRLTTVYLTSYFVGGALGSGAASLAWARGGWPAVCLVGALFGLGTCGLWLSRGPLLRAGGHGA